MHDIERVLVPVDFSAFGRTALAFARRLGQAGLTIQPAHVVEPWAPYVRRVLFPYAALGEDDVEFEHELIEAARAELDRHLDLDAEDAAVAEPIVRLGGRETLAEIARSTGADAVVMGAFGEGGVRAGALGSTAERLIGAIAQPVFLVRDFDRRPDLERIVVGVSLGPESAEVVDWALSLALQSGAQLELVFVLADPLAQDTNQLLARAIDYDRRGVIDRSRDRIAALYDRMVKQVEVAFASRDDAQALLANRKVLVGEPADALVSHADEVGADLVVVGTHSPPGRAPNNLGRVASRVARTSPTHVLVVPPTRQANLLSSEE